jgi:hypothetical protein
MKTSVVAALIAAAVGVAGLAASPSADAQTKKPASKSSKAVKKAAPAAAAAAAMAPLNAEQLSTADRVLTGACACEFDQTVNVSPVADQKGYFNVAYKGKTYVMAPEATTTGAVRLEDKKAGVVWLQIANKSMLMNSKIGQRMVDNCVHPNQKS